MYLSNRDIQWAIDCRRLIVSPRPEEMGKGYDETSVDLHLDRVEEAKVWNIRKLMDEADTKGERGPEVHIGRFNWGKFSRRYLINPPQNPASDDKVFQRGREVIVRP